MTPSVVFARPGARPLSLAWQFARGALDRHLLAREIDASPCRGHRLAGKDPPVSCNEGIMG